MGSFSGSQKDHVTHSCIKKRGITRRRYGEHLQKLLGIYAERPAEAPSLLGEGPTSITPHSSYANLRGLWRPSELGCPTFGWDSKYGPLRPPTNFLLQNRRPPSKAGPSFPNLPRHELGHPPWCLGFMWSEPRCAPCQLNGRVHAVGR